MKRSQYLSLGFAVLMLLSGFTALAQVRVTGKVTDETNLPVPGVTVQQANTQNRAATNQDGVYTITLQAGGSQSLIFTYIGYQSVTLPYTGANINVNLKPTSANLNEVVVLGYTSQKKSTITGAVGTVNMADAEKRRVPDVAQILLFQGV